jgi:hypothetical protein
LNVLANQPVADLGRMIADKLGGKPNYVRRRFTTILNFVLKGRLPTFRNAFWSAVAPGLRPFAVNVSKINESKQPKLLKMTQ